MSNGDDWVEGPGGEEWIRVLPVLPEFRDVYGITHVRVKKSLRHYHRVTNETYTLLKGRLVVYLGFTTHEISRPGDTLYIPPITRHHAVSLGDEPAELLVVTVPPWRGDDHVLVGMPVETITL